MSKTIGKINAIWKRLTNKEYRDAYVAGKVTNDIAFQVFYLREHRGWTQEQLAEEAGTKQPAISRLERSIGSVNVGTLVKIAAAFNVGLSIKFVPFSRLVAQAVNDRLDADITPFERDLPPLADAPAIRLMAKPLIHVLAQSDEGADTPFLFTHSGTTATLSRPQAQ